MRRTPLKRTPFRRKGKVERYKFSSKKRNRRHKTQIKNPKLPLISYLEF